MGAATPATSGPPGGRGSGRARSSAAVSISLLATSLLGAGQAFALLVIAGAEPETDAFLAAYSLYLPVAILGASLRPTVTNLVAAREPEESLAARASEIVSRCVLFGAALVTTLLVASPALATFMTHDLPVNVYGTTLGALLLLLPAAFLHMVAAALAGALGAAGRFGFSAVAYTLTGTASLLIAIGGLWLIGPLGASIGVLSGTILLAAAHLREGARLGIRVRLRPRTLAERVQWRVVAELITGAALGSAMQINLAISLAALAALPGAITAYSYAFFLSSMFLNLSSLPLALVTLPSLVGAARTGGRAAAGDHIVRLAPYAFAVVAPLAACFVFLGRPFVDAVFEPFGGERTAELIFTTGRALAVMTLPATLFHLASAASLPLATPGGRLVAAGAAVTLHAVAVILSGGDPDAVAWAHAAGMAVITCALLGQLMGRLAPSVVARTVRAGVPALVAASAFAVAGLAGGDDSLASAAAGTVLAGLVYVFALRLLAPSVVAAFVGLKRPLGGVA